MEWKISDKPVSYEEALAFMDERVAAIREGRAQECIWLLEHPPLYTAGTSAKDGDLLDVKFPVYETGRGGEYTYHGPGQRVVYVMLDLKKRQKVPDLKKYICDLQNWIVQSLAPFGVQGVCREGRVGVWVKRPPHPASAKFASGSLSLRNPPPPGGREGWGGGQEAKIAAIGVRVRHWITLHGVSINVNPDLSHYQGIVPCGISEFGVTSLADLGVKATMADLDQNLKFYCDFNN